MRGHYKIIKGHLFLLLRSAMISWQKRDVLLYDAQVQVYFTGESLPLRTLGARTVVLKRKEKDEPQISRPNGGPLTISDSVLWP
jgi:hypothetical protein